jgi:hypothetical protein
MLKLNRSGVMLSALIAAEPMYTRSRYSRERSKSRASAITLKAAYSVLNACIGSRRDARHAGRIHAHAATTSSVAATAA